VPEYFLVAKIQSAAGTDGFVRIISYSDFPDRFFNLKKVYIDFFNDKKLFYVDEVKNVKDFFILKFKNFENEKDVEVLIGKEIFVDEKDAVKLQENEYFIHDLIGSSVFRGVIKIGKIKEVLTFPANDVYVIESEGKELLIPAVREFIEKFDPIGKKLYIKPGANINYDAD
jgi:16S rRNA processing protein RimM